MEVSGSFNCLKVSCRIVVSVSTCIKNWDVARTFLCAHAKREIQYECTKEPKHIHLDIQVPTYRKVLLVSQVSLL